jgi:hypothetical protein
MPVSVDGQPSDMNSFLTWPRGFFERQDANNDADFYAAPRFVTHIDSGAVRAVSDLYDELAVPDGRVLDLMASWVSHLSRRPDGGLVLLGMNAAELAANPMAEAHVLHDLNQNPDLRSPTERMTPSRAVCRSTTWFDRLRFCARSHESCGRGVLWCSRSATAAFPPR